MHIQYLSLTWYWTSMLWSFDSCQEMVFADQCHLTVSQAQVHNAFIDFQLIAGPVPFFSVKFS